jgi:hypothetical protein
MKNSCLNNIVREVNLAFLITLILLSIIVVNKSAVLAAPQGATIIYNNTEDATIRSPDSHTAAGGSFTTLVLNVTSQTSKWKAYVGNVTGKLTLDNSNNKSIYEWALTTVQGEVYASKNDSINFSALTCSNRGNITAEDALLNINSSSDDSINKTFTQQIHRSFVIGGTGTIANSSCFAIATYVNDSSQPANENATFQEILLSDSKNLVYTTIINDNKIGFDTGTYDFQLIVPDDPGATSTTYFMYAELG